MASGMIHNEISMSNDGTMQSMNAVASAMNPNPNNPQQHSSTFDQTFNNVPQDLWKMPMTLEWDWADMTGYSGFEDGISMNGVLPDFGHQSGHGTSSFNDTGNMNGGR